MITKPFNWINSNIEKEKTFLLFSDVVGFIAFLAYLGFLYVTEPLKEFYLVCSMTTPYITVVMSVLCSVMFIYCFIISFFVTRELTTRPRGGNVPCLN